MSIAVSFPPCRLCSHAPLQVLPGVGRIPLLPSHAPATAQPLLCPACGSVQLDRGLVPTALFADASDFDQAHDVRRQECDHLAGRLVSRFTLTANDRVLDVGSNDGTLIEAFRTRGVPALGVEAAPRRVAHSLRHGRKAVHGQFGPVLAGYLARRFGPFRLVVARLPLGILPDLPAFFRALAGLLSANGAAVLQVRHAAALERERGGEMLHAFSPCAVSLAGVAQSVAHAGLALTDAEAGPPRTASLYITLRSVSAHATDRLKARMQYERQAGLCEANGWSPFAASWGALCQAARQRLHEMAWQGVRFVGYGASPDALAMLEALQLAPGTLNAILDANARAHGTLVFGVPVVAMGQAIARWDAVLVLDRTQVDQAVREVQCWPSVAVWTLWPQLHEVTPRHSRRAVA